MSCHGPVCPLHQGPLLCHSIHRLLLSPQGTCLSYTEWQCHWLFLVPHAHSTTVRLCLAQPPYSQGVSWSQGQVLFLNSPQELGEPNAPP